MIATAGLVVGLRQAAAATVDPNAWYQFVSRHSGKAMDVAGWSTVDGGGIQQWVAVASQANQQFQFVDAGNGYYKLRNRHSGKVIEVANASDGASVYQFTDNGNTRQHFRLADSDSGYVRFISRHSNKALDLWEWSTTDGGRISQFTDLGGFNQQWQLIVVGSGGTPDPQPGACGSGAFNAEAVLSGSTWTARNGGSTLYTGGDLLSAMRAAVNSLSAGRTAKQRVVVRGSGSMSAAASLDLPSFTVLDVCGTINVTGALGADNAPVRMRNVTDVEVQHLNLTGGVYFGIFVRNGTNITLGQIDMRFGSAGLGIRIDNHSNRAVRTRNVRIGTVFQSGGGSHAVETYGVDGITIGTVTARNTGESGLLLNDTINATIGTVDAEGAGTGTGYAAFRMANRNGRIGSAYPTNIRVGTVRARGGGRGIFCVSESGGAVIDRVDIAQTGGNAVLIENCYGVTLAGISGTIAGPGDIRVAARTEFPPSSNIVIQNLTATNTAITESPCGGGGNIVRNVTRVNTGLSWCS
jgi:hypothetical protein